MKKIILYAILIVVLLQSCKKLIEVGTPQNQLTTDKVFSDTTSAQATIAGVYANFNVSIDPNFNKYTSLYTDELTYPGTSTDAVEYYQSKISTSNGINLNSWNAFFLTIYQCNDIIAQLSQSTLPSATIIQLTSEAKFLRAYSYFHLINLYGHIPLLLTTDVNVNAHATQTEVINVYNQIIQDLKDAQNGLTSAYAGGGRVRANKYAVSALLAKVYLYNHDWVNSESQASLVLNSGLYTPLQVLGNVFLANSQETILSFWTINGYITDAPNLIPSSGIPQYPLSPILLNAFETGDLRKAKWLNPVTVSGITYYYPYKYHNRTTNTTTPEYLVALRAGEQYLIRAEAEANGAGSGLPGAISDLNIIRKRAGLGSYSGSSDQKSVLTAIYHERQVEMFCENSNRLFDLNRTGTINTIIGGNKSTWVTTANLWPIPQNEITYDPKLKQNPGY